MRGLQLKHKLNYKVITLIIESNNKFILKTNILGLFIIMNLLHAFQILILIGYYTTLFQKAMITYCSFYVCVQFNQNK